MSEIVMGVVGVIIGFVFAAIFLVPTGLGECRAANPSFDCDIGWVRGEAFK